MPLQSQNIVIAGGTDDGKVYLSCCANGKVDLYTKDDGSGRQLWKLEPSDDMSYYHITVHGGTDSGKKYLSCTAGGLVDLYSRDDGSGRQQWLLEEVKGAVANTYHIKPRAGTNSDKKFLSCRADGLVDLYDKDDGSCRQRWRVERDELLRLELIGAPKVLSTKPKYVVQDVVDNPTKAEISKEFGWTESKTTTERWAIHVGAQFSMAQEVKVGTGAAPGGEETTKLGLTLSFDATRTWGTDNTEGRQQKYTVKVPPETSIKCSGLITDCETDVPFKMVFKSGKEVTGSWKGVLQSECRITTEDLTGKDF